MFEGNISFLFDSLLVFILAFLIDILFGEAPDRFHPTLWMGTIAGRLKPKLRNDNPKIEKINGIFLCLGLLALFVTPTYFGVLWIRESFGWLVYIVASALILQTTFAIKCMKQYTLPVAEAVEKQDYETAKQYLPFIVRRNPNGLTSRHIISAAVETIAEGTTDGITSPFFYFALFGVSGAVAFRVINTLDSMVGYKDKEHINIGWFSASMDTIVNYIPTRLTAILMVLSAFVLRNDWKKSWRILRRDNKNTISPNAGWTISAMAGALNIQLEKPGHYIIGDENSLLPMHITKALQIMLMTSILFVIFVVFPLLFLRVTAI
ncbi:MAG: cobalamin biosynthesis protein [Candidatus Bathyarchaeum tardum]|nr:MAG: cobalamin biosynthesis protein [Candidatus Bathyarchaeum tardum]